MSADGDPTATRWDNGHRDTSARLGHNRDTRERRRRVSAAHLDDLTPTLLAALREDGDLARAATSVGASLQRVHGRMRWDAAWAGPIEELLAAACAAAADECGTRRGYRAGGRCAACREAKAADRGVRPAPPPRRPCANPDCERLLPADASPRRQTCSARCRVAKSKASSP